MSDHDINKLRDEVRRTRARAVDQVDQVWAHYRQQLRKPQQIAEIASASLAAFSAASRRRGRRGLQNLPQNLAIAGAAGAVQYIIGMAQKRTRRRSLRS